MRQQAGFAGLPELDDLWRSRDRIISTSLAAFDAAPVAGLGHGAPRRPRARRRKIRGADAPALAGRTIRRRWCWSASRPASNSATSTSCSARSTRWRDLPVHVVATTGGIVAPNELASPPNAIVLNYAAHDPILRRAALVVTHGGHGTAMRALRHGVPMVVIPGPGRRSAVRRCSGAGMGRRPRAAGRRRRRCRCAPRRTTCSPTPSYRANARARSAALAGVDGAANAAGEVENLLHGAPAARRSGHTECQPAA